VKSIVFLLLLACVEDEDGDGPNPVASGDDTGTTDTTACVLDTPWTIETSDDVGEASLYIVPAITDIEGYVEQVAASAAAEGCPVASTDGDTIVYAGDCSTSTGTWSGTLTVAGTGWTFDAVRITDDGTAYDFTTFDADGTLTFTETETDAGTETSADYDLSYTVEGGATDGTFAYTGGFACDATEACTLSEEADVQATGATRTGQYCVDYSDQPAASCGSEPDATITITGSAVGVLTWDGSTACDGCAEVTIDGAEADPYCENVG
jgi:hypothetical protein